MLQIAFEIVIERKWIRYKWDKIFKNGPSKTCGKYLTYPLSYPIHITYMVCTYPFKSIKDCLPQILLCPFLNTLFQIYL